MPSRREVAIADLLNAGQYYADAMVECEPDRSEEEVRFECANEIHGALRELGVTDTEISQSGWWDE